MCDVFTHQSKVAFSSYRNEKITLPLTDQYLGCKRDHYIVQNNI